MGKFIDLTGQQFGRLTVIRQDVPTPSGKTRWVCCCECQTEKSVQSSDLRSGKTRSCGCLQRERSAIAGRANATHGMSRHSEPDPTYVAWQGMKTRCLNQNTVDWPNYGGRGIIICPEWVDSFETFYACVGDRPGPDYSLDRIDTDGNYEPSNVRWATWKEQAASRRRLTHCRKCGFPFDESNTYINPKSGWRTCRNCRRAKRIAKRDEIQQYQNEWRRKRREAKAND